MNLFGIHFSDPFVNTIGWTLVHSLWQGLLVFLVYRLAMHFIKPSLLKTRYAVAVSALVAIPLMAVITFGVLYPDHQIDHADKSYQGQVNPIALKTAALLQTHNLDIASSHQAIQIIFQRLNTITNEHLNLIVVCWLTGLMFFVFRLIGGYFFSQRLRKYQVRCAPEHWIERTCMFKNKIKIKLPVQLLESARVKVPTVVGFFKPIILIPLGVITQIPADQLDAILIHELVHIFRKDYIINILQAIIEAIFFFNPFVWRISRQIRIEREYLCDEMTLGLCKDRLTYIKALTSIQDFSHRPPLFAAALASDKPKLLARIKRIVEPNTSKLNITGGFIMLLILLSAIAITTSAAITFSQDADVDLIVSQLLKKEKRAGFSSTQQLGSIHFIPNTGTAFKRLANEISGSSQAVPDTTKKPDTSSSVQKEVIREYEEAIEAQEKARQRLQEAQKEHQEAIEQYRESIRQQQDEYQKNRQQAIEEYEIRMREMPGKDSIHYRTQVRITPDRGFWFDDNLLPLEQDFPEDMGVRDYYFSYPDPMDIPDPLIVPMPAMPDLGETYLIPYHHKMSKTESIMKNELLKDGIIERGEECVVYIDSNEMLVNGVRQSREVFKKYKRLLETARGEALDKGLTFFY